MCVLADPAVASVGSTDRRVERLEFDEPRQPHRQPEAAVGTRKSRPRRSSTRLREPLAKRRRHPDDPVRGAGSARRRPAGRLAVPICDDHAGRDATAPLGAEAGGPAEGNRRASPTSRPIRIAPGRRSNVVIDRDAAARLGVNTAAIDNALNNAYAQRQLSTIYTQRNQYKVVLEIDPALQVDPSLLDRIYVGCGGRQAGAAVAGRAVRARDGAAGGAPSGPVSRPRRSAST